MVSGHVIPNVYELSLLKDLLVIHNTHGGFLSHGLAFQVSCGDDPSMDTSRERGSEDDWPFRASETSRLTVPSGGSLRMLVPPDEFDLDVRVSGLVPAHPGRRVSADYGGD